MTLNISSLSTNNSSLIQEILITSDNSLSVPKLILKNQKILGTWTLFPSEGEFYKPNFLIEKSDSYLTMLASENVLSKDWDTPEEDEAWVNL